MEKFGTKPLIAIAAGVVVAASGFILYRSLQKSGPKKKPDAKEENKEQTENPPTSPSLPVVREEPVE